MIRWTVIPEPHLRRRSIPPARRASRAAGLFATALLACASVAPAAADTAPAKRALSVRDFDAWRSIASQVLSRDGHYLAYSYMPLEGDGEVIVRDLRTGNEQRLAVGALPPPPLTTMENNPERPKPRREVAIAFTSDSRFVVATAFPTRADTDRAKRENKKPEELPKEGLVVLDVASGAIARPAAVKSFQLPAHGGAWLAYLKEPAAAATKEPEPSTSSAKPHGSDLILRDLRTGTERAFPHVTEYALTRDGQTLVFIVDSPARTENGVYAVSPATAGPPVALAAGPGRYRKFTWDRTEMQAAFLADRTEVEAKAPRFSLWYWKRGDAAAAVAVTSATPGLPANWSVSGEAAPAFSFDGSKLVVFTAPPSQVPDERLATVPEDEKVTADLWRWNDDFLPTLQEKQAEQERRRAYAGVLDLGSRKFVQLSDPSLATLTFTDDGARAFGLDDRPYRRRLDYDGAYNDLYLVDVATGARHLVARELGEKAGPRWSHNGRWLAFYDARQWFAVEARTGATHSLTAGLTVGFFDERDDHPELPPSYGAAGWTADGESLLLYDRYDLWQVFPDGRPARNVTSGFGRANRIQLRLQPIEPTEPGSERRGVDPEQPLYFRGEHEDTHATGFFRAAFTGGTAPERLLWADRNYRYLGRALDADALLLSGGRFDEFPDLLVTDSRFATPAKVTDGGAQLAPFLWGSAEPITYRNLDGVELAGTLYKPANFDPHRKYPMIVYVYERLSQIVHNFTPPVPAAYLNHTFYTSNDYLVLMPDIIYTTGHPGQSALKCVLPAVDEVVRRGYVDEHAIGLSGHSWGGYEVSYLVTQTSRFRAAEAGALVCNMISAYSGIGWGSGRARQFKYEKNQSRIGATIQDAPELYYENSPVFFADRVRTPLLIVHNDQDDTVPWYQAIEYFLALRRHDREVYFFNYNREFHGLRRRADQKDFTRRMQQFFDHFLKGAPAPAWIAQGIPYLERDEEKLRFDATP